MKLETVKWGFIGCGNVTEKKSGPAFSQIEGSEVIAVMSRTAEKAASYAKRHNIPKWYTSAQELIADEEVNAIYVATPPSSHSIYAMLAMKAGKPVYIEKPMANSYEECLRIVRTSEATGIPCFVAYYRRFLPYFLKVKELIEQKAIGTIMNVQIRFAQQSSDLDYNKENLPWRIQPDIAGGGYFYDLAPHQLDMMQYIFGPILDAEGFKTNRAHLYDAEDTVTASFRFESGVLGSGSWCFASYHSAKEDCIEIVGNKGIIRFATFIYTPIELHTEKGVETFQPENPKHVQTNLIKKVVEHLQGKCECNSDAASATVTNWAMDRILNKI